MIGEPEVNFRRLDHLQYAVSIVDSVRVVLLILRSSLGQLGFKKYMQDARRVRSEELSSSTAQKASSAPLDGRARPIR